MKNQKKLEAEIHNQKMKVEESQMKNRKMTLTEKLAFMFIKFVAKFNGATVTAKKEKVKYKKLFAFKAVDRHTGHQGIVYASTIQVARFAVWQQANQADFGTAPNEIFCTRAKQYDNALTIEGFKPLPSNLYDQAFLNPNP